MEKGPVQDTVWDGWSVLAFPLDKRQSRESLFSFNVFSNSNSPSLIESLATNICWHGLSHHLTAVWDSAARVKLKLEKIMLRACHNPEAAVMSVINSRQLNKETNLHVRELLCLITALIPAPSPLFSLRNVGLPVAQLRASAWVSPDTTSTPTKTYYILKQICFPSDLLKGLE